MFLTWIPISSDFVENPVLLSLAKSEELYIDFLPHFLYTHRWSSVVSTFISEIDFRSGFLLLSCNFLDERQNRYSCFLYVCVFTACLSVYQFVTFIHIYINTLKTFIKLFITLLDVNSLILNISESIWIYKFVCVCECMWGVCLVFFTYIIFNVFRSSVLFLFLYHFIHILPI